MWQICEIRVFDLAGRLPVQRSQAPCGPPGNHPITSLVNLDQETERMGHCMVR